MVIHAILSSDMLLSVNFLPIQAVADDITPSSRKQIIILTVPKFTAALDCMKYYCERVVVWVALGVTRRCRSELR